MERADDSLRFTPCRSEGWPAVSEIILHPDRIEFLTAGRWKTFAFEDMVQWPHATWLWKLRKRWGMRPLFLPVGERDWFRAEGEKFFIFYTQPRLTVYLPVEEGVNYHQSLFRRLQDVLLKGGYHTWDLG